MQGFATVISFTQLSTILTVTYLAGMLCSERNHQQQTLAALFSASLHNSPATHYKLHSNTVL